MSYWLNHVTILANSANPHTGIDPSNPTGQGTVLDGAGFTPTAGNLLVCFVGSAATSTTPSGWTLPTGGSSVNSQGLYAFYKTAAGSDTVTTTHNGTTTCVFDFYEFASAAAFASATGGRTTNGVSRTLSGLTGTNFVLSAVAGAAVAGTWAFSGSTAQADVSQLVAPGFHYGSAFISSTASSVAVTGTLEDHEQVMVAFTGVAPDPNATVVAPVATATASAAVPVVSAASSVSPPAATASASASAPVITSGTNATVAPPAATATASAPAPVITQIIPAGTDTTNFLNGRNRRARASVTVTRPVASPPSNLATKVDKAVPLPPPTLVDGRVT